MNMEEIRHGFRRIAFIFIAILNFVLFLRFVAIFFNFNPQQVLISWLLSATNGLVGPFVGLSPNLYIGVFTIDVPTVAAIVVYTLMLLLFFDFLATFIDDDLARIGINLLDILLKIFEFLLMTRVVLKVLGVAATNSFVNGIYAATEWASGLVAPIPFANGVIEVSVVIVFIVIVIIDVWLESVVLKWLEAKRTHHKVIQAKVVSRQEFERLKSQS